MHSNPGLIWTIEHLAKDGQVLDTETIHNLMPTQGLNHWIDVLLGKTAQNAQWYIGLFATDYTPLPTDTANSFPADAGEFTGYSGTTRLPFTVPNAAGGEADNFGAPAEFNFTAGATIYGGFICSSSGKSATSGVLLSATRFAVPKVKEFGEMLRVKAVLGLLSD